jgi:hypothetical protein
MNLSLDALREAVNIREQIEALEQRLAWMFQGDSLEIAEKSRGNSSSGPSKRRGARTMSAAARAKIAAAQRARWAAKKSGASQSAKAAKKKRTVAVRRRQFEYEHEYGLNPASAKRAPGAVKRS